MDDVTRRYIDERKTRTLKTAREQATLMNLIVNVDGGGDDDDGDDNSEKCVCVSRAQNWNRNGKC